MLLENPTPTRIRERREWIAHLVNQYRHNVQNPPEPATLKEALKALYRKAAALLHPDRAHDDADRQYRHKAMTQVNLAYRARDIRQIQAILDDHELSAELGAYRYH